MVGRQIDDRVLAGRKDLADLRRPDAPRIAAPEVVHPQEPAFQQVLAEPRGLALVEVHRSNLGHHHERALKQRVVGEPDEQMVRLELARSG